MAIRKIETKSGLKYVAYFKHMDRQITKRFIKRSDAVAWEAETKKKLRELENLPPALMFSKVAETYLLDCEQRMQPGTVAEKYRHLSEFATWLKGDIAAETLTVAQAKGFIAHTCAMLNNKSANRRLRNLKACWNWHKEVLPSNPWTCVQPYSEDEFIKYIPSAGDVLAVFSAAALWEKRMLTFLLATGARSGEMFRLEWTDVNFERNTLTLWTRKRKGGNRQARLTPISPSLKAVLRELETENTAASPYVFVNPETGDAYYRQLPSIRYMLKRLCKKCELKEFGFHALRHFVAARLMDSRQTNIVEIQQLLGHQRTTTTDLYLRSLSSSIGHLADIIEKEVLPVNTVKKGETNE